MKKYFLSIISLITISSSVLTFTACEDMLTVSTDDKSYTNANDTVYSYNGILRCLQDVAERQVLLGELRGDLVSTTEYVTDTLFAIANFDNPQDGSCSMLNIRDYFNVINNCNLYLHNADTNMIKSNVKYMIPEFAQVNAIRAWTYLQLVQNYGEVPFITTPITSLDDINKFDYDNNLINKDNLIDKMLEIGLDKYVDTEYPQYNNWDNGSIQFDSRLQYFPINLLLGDMYLLRGRDNNDYRKAATYYYTYLNKTLSTTTTQYCQVIELRGNSDEDYSLSRTSISSDEFWGTWAGNYNFKKDKDLITAIPSAANRKFGKLLTKVADVYGYTPTSSQSTNESQSTDANGSTTTNINSAGRISVTPNHKSQTKPSDAYTSINKRQTYIYYDNALNTPKRIEYKSGDARYYASREKNLYEGEPYELCCKAATEKEFYYSIPIYRKTLVWLRLAEAINRSGYPQLAFAILKDGLCDYNIPKHASKIEQHAVLDENGKNMKDPETGFFLYASDTTYYMKTNNFGALYYVDSLEIDNFYLDFTNDVWSGNYGIHARGCGFGNWPIQSSENIRTNISGYGDSIVYDYNKLILAQGYKPEVKEEAINAVENIIADELALEFAFEGNRFTDLVRLANHKDASGFNGTEWLAKKIASRNILYNNIKRETTGSQDMSLYNKLLNKNNWYFSKPIWKK